MLRRRRGADRYSTMDTLERGQIRRAIADDAPALAALRYDFRAASRPAIESREEFVPRFLQWIRPRLASNAPWRVWVLEYGGSVVGNVWLQLVDKLPNPNARRELHGYITNFFLRPEHRNGGAGSRLLEAVLEECKRSNVDAVFLWPTERSRPFYERHGFKPPSDMLAREV